MNPTQEQLGNRLNPTAVNLNVPGEGSVFRSDGPTSDTIFMIKDGKLQQVSLGSLGFQAEQAAGRLTMTPYGWDGPATHQQNGLVNVGRSELSRLYGVDFNSIPQIPEGKIADLSGLIRDGKLQAGGEINLNNLKTALTTGGAPGTTVTVNNTPNALATPQQIAQQMQNPNWNAGSGSQQGSVPTPGGIDPVSGLPYVNPNSPQGPYGVQGGGSSGTGGASAGTTTGGATGGGPDLSGLPPEFQQLYTQLDTYLQKLQQNGQVLNPNIQLDPSKIAEFLGQAKTEIDPYYAGQLKLATDSLSKSINYATENQTNQEGQLQRDYTGNLRTLGENSADQGFAQSGIRKRQEGDLAYDTQNTIDQSRRELSYNAGNTASGFAQKYGTGALPNFSIGNAPRVLAGESNFASGGGTSPLYQLSPEVYNGLIGSEQYQQTADVKNRASQLEEAFRTTQGISQARQLIS